MTEHFPDDWIMPGEFRFCSAGWHLLPGNTPQPCPCCSQTPAASQYEAALRNCRQKLARARKDAGLERLFWMRVSA